MVGWGHKERNLKVCKDAINNFLLYRMTDPEINAWLLLASVLSTVGTLSMSLSGKR